MRHMKSAVIFFLFPFLMGCSTKELKQISYNKGFEIIDTSQDGIITIEEFSSCFPDSAIKFPEGADADADGMIYPDEWFEFKEKMGYLPPEK